MGSIRSGRPTFNVQGIDLKTHPWSSNGGTSTQGPTRAGVPSVLRVTKNLRNRGATEGVFLADEADRQTASTLRKKSRIRDGWTSEGKSDTSLQLGGDIRKVPCGVTGKTQARKPHSQETGLWR